MILTLTHAPVLRGPSAVDLSDLTASCMTGDAAWVDATTLDIPFDTEPTATERAAIVRRLLTRDAAHEAQVKAMQEALAALPVSPTSPTERAVVLLLRAELGPLAPPTN